MLRQVEIISSNPVVQGQSGGTVLLISQVKQTLGVLGLHVKHGKSQ
jgi:hypothetical protein